MTLAETGLETMTGGRIRRVRKYVEDETFMVTYGDGVATSISRSCWTSTRSTASWPP